MTACDEIRKAIMTLELYLAQTGKTTKIADLQTAISCLTAILNAGEALPIKKKKLRLSIAESEAILKNGKERRCCDESPM